jgi:hypothetical protein
MFKKSEGINRIAGLFFLLGWLTLLGVPVQAQSEAFVASGPIVIHDAHHGISPPLSMIPRVVPSGGVRHEADEGEHHQPPTWLRSPSTDASVDSVIQNSLQPSVAATYGLNFEGIGAGFSGFSLSSAPPDTNGAVGATQFVQTVNASFAVFDKNTGALVLGAADISTLFQSLSGSNCALQHESDPVVLYDKLAGRWLISIIDGDGGKPQKFSQCIAVSTSSDATGTWNLYDFNSLGTTLPDYGKWGAWPDAYYYTSDAFPVSGNGWEEACAFDRAAILLNNGQPLQSVCFQNFNQFALMPSDMDGTTPPPSGEPNFYIGLGSGHTSLELFKFHVDFTTTANSTFTGPTVIPVTAYSPLCNNTNAGQCVPQLGTTQKLDSLNFTPMFRLAYRNFGTHESLVVNHSVDAGSTGGVRWYEIQSPNATPTVFQQGTWAGGTPDANWRWMASVAMDNAGDIGAGYSISSGAMHPAIAVTGRTPADLLGTFETETIVFDGPGSQTPTLNRWGDYSALTVDPVDDCTFWFTTEYIPSPNGAFNWHTRIASFRMSSCTPIVALPDFTLSPSQGTVNITPGGSDSNTTITFSPLNGFSSTVNLTVAVTGAPPGITASLSPTSVTSGSPTSTLTISTTSASPGGSFTLVITGTGGGLSRTAYVTVALPGFSLVTSNSGNVFVNQGASATNTITVNTFNGFSSGVNLSTSALPNGVTALFNPNPATSASTLTLTASGTAATTVPVAVTVTGTSGTLTQTATINVAVSAATGTGGTGTPVSLSSAYNVAGIYNDKITFSATGGLDGGGAAYSSNLLTPNRILNGVQFNFGPASTSNCTSTCILDAVTGETAAPFNGGPITLPAGQFATLQLLATGIQGNQTAQTVSVTYTDSTTSSFTQNFSDWFSPQKNAGELEAVAMAYRDSSNGSPDNRPFNLYGYSFALNSTKTVKSFTLPNNRNVVVLAATLTGQIVSPGYLLTAGAASPASIAPGGSSTATVTVTPAGGYTGAVTLSCSISPVVGGATAPTCSLSPNPVSVTGGAATSTLTFATVPAGGAAAHRPATIHSMTRPGRAAFGRADTFYGALVVLPGLALIALGVGSRHRPRKRLLGLLFFWMVLTSLILLPACGGGYSGGGGGGCSSAPGIPTGLAASSATSSGTTLTWTASTAGSGCSVAGYKVYQNGSVIATTTPTNYNVTGLAASTQYSFTVAATDSYGTSGQSSAVSVTTLSSGTPAGTYTITITGKDANNVTQTGNAPDVTVTVN